jgi:hypothetical protein
MFRIKEVTLYRGVENKTYCLTDNTYIYGNNSVGKTAFTKALDFVLGSSDSLSHDGLNNIDAVGAYITNNKTELWIMRSTKNEFSYKRTENSEYSVISHETYKDRICNMITDNVNSKEVQVYKKVFEENPSFRSFTFINFVDEIGQGDLGSIFTRGKDSRHIVRIRKIMDFFFNYENAEKIYEKSLELEKLENEYKNVSERIRAYEQSRSDVQGLFSNLGLNYSGEMSQDYETFLLYKNQFSRENSKSKGDLAYLIRASHSLAEEIKIYGYLKNQSEVTSSRKDRTEKLLSMLRAIVTDNPNYAEEVSTISNMINEIEKDKIILSLADYDASIKKIKKEKETIDEEIQNLQNRASELDYEETIKKLALLENCFNVINSDIDINKATSINNQISTIKSEIKELKNNYSQKAVDDFNKRLTDMYLNSNVKNVKYLNDDRAEPDFSLKFDPFSQVLVAYHREGEANVAYTPGSMARHNHLQLLVYLCMLEYLHNKFSDFIYLPVLIMDSADQPMDSSSFDEIYPTITEIANDIGVQTIFISKIKPDCVSQNDLIDISGGLNPFHQKMKNSG